jgi:hypothetical protein
MMLATESSMSSSAMRAALPELDRRQKDFVVERGVLGVGAALGDDGHAHPGGAGDVLGVGAHGDAGGERLDGGHLDDALDDLGRFPLFGNPSFHRVACDGYCPPWAA